MRTAVSLFAGVGGFDLALERNGVKVVASIEIDKNAQEVLKKHFPQSTIFGDITGVTGEQLIAAGFEPRTGIITGGFPCQDLSVAGKRAGLGGSRSGLFWEICRLLDETRAQNFILKMSLVYFPAIKAQIWPLFLKRWSSAGIASPTGCLMLNTSEFPNAVVECSLSDVLETQGNHLKKYSLSPKAAQGILRRANRREKTLPPQLEQALRVCADSVTT